VAQGIDSISLNPDSVLKTMLAIVETEKVIATSAQAHAMKP
jgi:phosphoenolpyruvate synthase/pyruvate phosphate dikinase